MASLQGGRSLTQKNFHHIGCLRTTPSCIPAIGKLPLNPGLSTSRPKDISIRDGGMLRVPFVERQFYKVDLPKLQDTNSWLNSTDQDSRCPKYSQSEMHKLLLLLMPPDRKKPDQGPRNSSWQRTK
ncbi:hypothetical protein TNCV_3917181 [Trichonephila clavipes]|nr:hypothetical protein TNCV_3917181 [Trichonephila clavipes]